MSGSQVHLLIMATIAIFGLMVAPPCAAYNFLSSPKSLYITQALTTGSYALVMQHDCNLVLYDDDQKIWATNTSGHGPGCRLTLDNNGNLAIYDRYSPDPIWQTGTGVLIDNHCVLALQQDRNVVIYGPAVWSTQTVGLNVGLHNAISSVDATAGAMVALSSAAPADNILTSPNSLLSGQALTTDYFRLVMREDCHLVLYDAGRRVWQTTAPLGANDCHLTLHNNGNLVVYSPANQIVWQSGTNGEVNYYVLVLRQDRNVVVYGPAIWATETGTSAVGVTGGPHNATASVDAAAQPVIKSVAARAMLK